MNCNQAIQDYSHYLNIERGLSSNTIDSYVLDVNKLILFLENKNISCSPVTIKNDIIQQFIYEVAKKSNN